MGITRKAITWFTAFVLVAGLFPSTALAEAGSITAAGGGVSGLDAVLTGGSADDASELDGSYSLVGVEQDGAITITGIVKDGSEPSAGASLGVLADDGSDGSDDASDSGEGSGSGGADIPGLNSDLVSDPDPAPAPGDNDTPQGDGIEYPITLVEKGSADLVIPSVIHTETGDKTVTAIGDNAFENENWIASVTIPSSVKTIGGSTFQGCANLKTATLTEGLELIGSYAFAKTGLTAISVPKTAALGSYAFYDCDSLASATLPEGVRYASAYYREKNSGGSDYYYYDDDYYDYDNDSIFESCDALASIKVPASLRGVASDMFRYCYSLELAELAQGITYIGSHAFYNCSKLASFNIPEGVTSVGYGAFEYCKPESTIVLPTTLIPPIGERAFYWSGNGYWDSERDEWVENANVYRIKAATWEQYWPLAGNGDDESLYVNKGTTEVIKPDYEEASEVTFKYASNGEETVKITGYSGSSAKLVIPDVLNSMAVTEIDEGVFKDANWIESLEIPASVKVLGYGAFRNCLAMKSVTLSEGLELIGSSAFSKTGLTSVSVPQTAALGSSAFYDCDSLASATLPEGVRYASAYYREKNSGGSDYYYDDDYYDYDNDSIFESCDALASIKVPASLRGVASDMFWSCDSLKSAELAQGITYIASHAFYDCSKLASFNIPEGVTSVGYGAFDYCKPASTVVLPATLTSIGERAFCWYGNEYWDDDKDKWIEEASYTIDTATWDQYWKLLGNKRYINASSTLVREPKNAGTVDFDLKTMENSDGTLSVTGYVACANPPKKLEIPASIGGKSVTAIASEAFEDANWIESVVVPSSVKTVANEAFRGSYTMKSVSLADGLELISSYAFAQTGLESVSVPKTAALGGYAFYECDSLASAVLPEGVRYASSYYRERNSNGSSYYDDDYDYDDNGSIFENCDALASVKVPASLRGITWGMFRYCDSLKSVEIAQGITYIASCAFYDCYELENFSIPEGVTSVGYRAFADCRPTSVVVLPTSLTSIGEYAFYWYSRGGYWDDDKHEYVEADPYVIETSTWEQYWTLYGNERYINTYSTEVRAPIGAVQDQVKLKWKLNDDGETVTITGVEHSVARVVVPSYVDASESVSTSALSAAGESLATQATGYKVVAIGEGAFKGQSNIISVVLPDTVEKIEASAFANCAALADVLIPESVTDIATGAFDESENVKFICAEGSKAAEYANANGIDMSSLIPLTLATVELADGKIDYDWDADGGATLKPAVTVKLGEKTLEEGKDYQLERLDANVVGANYITVKAVEGGGYSEENVIGFRIKANLASAVIGPIDEDDCVYDGSPVQPRPTVTLHGTTLKGNVDIVYSWENNDAPGTATVIVTSANENVCYGSKSQTFTIKDALTPTPTPDPNPKPAPTPEQNAAQNSTAHETTVIEQKTEPDKQTGADKKNDQPASTTQQAVQQVTSQSISIAAATIQLAGGPFAYTGAQIAPQVASVTLGGALLPAQAYQVSYGENVNVGKGTVTVAGQGSYTGTATAEFDIAKAAQKIALGKAVKKGSKVIKRAKLKKAAVAFKLGAQAKGKLSYTLDKKAKRAKIKVTKAGKVIVPKNCKAGKYAITVKAKATKNYKANARTVTIVVKK